MCTACVWYRTCINIPLFLPFQRSLSHVFLMSTYFLMIYFIIYRISHICCYLSLLHCWPLSLITLVTSLIPSVAAENTVPPSPLHLRVRSHPRARPSPVLPHLRTEHNNGRSLSCVIRASTFVLTSETRSIRQKCPVQVLDQPVSQCYHLHRYHCWSQ